MNCKAGDLALVASNPFTENLGAVVKVLGACAFNGPEFWLCRVEGRPLWGQLPDGLMSTSDKHHDLISMPDKYLKPISGLPMEDDVDQGVKEPA